ncbi:MAG TPA: magnesium transporter, partial [Flavobacteriaceae bacterium]|nr:magnesium transporter [Flavobacteriaceae bacterium]
MTETKINFKKLIKKRDWGTLKTALNELEPVAIAEVIEESSEANRIIIFGLLETKQSTKVFKLLDQDMQEEIIDEFAGNIRRISRLLNNIRPDDRTAFFVGLPGKVTQKLIEHLSPEERKITTKLLGYPEESIGRLMTPQYVALKPDFTVEEAFRHIRKQGENSETLNVVYILDEDEKLIDDITIRELILAEPTQKIADLIDYRFISLNAMEDQETAIQVFKDYDRVALPVVDEEDGILIGIVTFDDILDVVELESTEDFHKFGAFRDTVANPLKERIGSLYKSRVVWLVALVFMNVFSGAAIMRFENLIEAVVALVFFLPLLIDSGGNAGSQSATLMIRSLAIGDVQMKDWYKLIGREFLVSFLLGITMAIGVAAVASFRAPEVIPVVAATMVATVMLGSTVGLLLPFIFTKLKLDPATASAPLITSISDIGGVIIYFS